ncbi:MAG: hypothetical protein J7J01_07000 [Methanophagales archaeon]|nr:hypothetical protein [Methanophagales archaeon]
MLWGGGYDTYLTWGFTLLAFVELAGEKTLTICHSYEVVSDPVSDRAETERFIYVPKGLYIVFLYV